jgi:hypothetical protein
LVSFSSVCEQKAAFAAKGLRQARDCFLCDNNAFIAAVCIVTLISIVGVERYIGRNQTLSSMLFHLIIH